MLNQSTTYRNVKEAGIEIKFTFLIINQNSILNPNIIGRKYKILLQQTRDWLKLDHAG